MVSGPILWPATVPRASSASKLAGGPKRPDGPIRGSGAGVVPCQAPRIGPEGRQALASALFTKLEVEGYQKMTYALTPDAVTLGLGAAPPAQTETGGHTGGFGRGERGSASLAHLRFRPQFVLENVTPAARSWPAAYRKAG